MRSRPRHGDGQSGDFAATQSSNASMRLLIIEDDREAADYLVKAFREVGHVADLASDGEDGLALAEAATTTCWSSTACCRKRDGLSVIGALARQGQPHAGADPLGARPGRRPRQGPARRRRRLSAQALFLRRTAGARRGAVAPPRRAGGGDRLPGRRSRARPAVAPRQRAARTRSTCSRANSGCSNI